MKLKKILQYNGNLNARRILEGHLNQGRSTWIWWCILCDKICLTIRYLLRDWREWLVSWRPLRLTRRCRMVERQIANLLKPFPNTADVSDELAYNGESGIVWFDSSPGCLWCIHWQNYRKKYFWLEGVVPEEWLTMSIFSVGVKYVIWETIIRGKETCTVDSSDYISCKGMNSTGSIHFLVLWSEEYLSLLISCWTSSEVFVITCWKDLKGLCRGK